MNKKITQNWLFIVLTSVLLYSFLQNYKDFLEFLSNAISLFTPFLVGGSIAFILNVPMTKIENTLFNKSKKYARPLALVTTLVSFVGAFYLITVLIVPSLSDAFSALPQQFSVTVDNISSYAQSFSVSNDDIKTFVNQLALDWESISKSLLSIAQNLINKTLSSSTSLLGSLVSLVVNSIVSFIFAIYILLQKEKLSKHIKMVIFAILPEKQASKLIQIANMSHDVFSKFLSGQCLEALILGCMFVIAMTVFKMPYAILIGVLVSITALIPLVGAFIACAIGIILIALVNPMQALGFLALFLILQQIEGNLIYPYVVGNSVGLPSIWVLVASYIGGNLIGLLGMIIAIPTSSILYSLFREYIYNRLTKKSISIKSLGDDSI